MSGTVLHRRTRLRGVVVVHHRRRENGEQIRRIERRELQLSATEDEMEFNPGTAWDHLAIGVDDVDEAVERIDHGGVLQEPADQPAADVHTAFVEDLDGHAVELIEPLDG